MSCKTCTNALVGTPEQDKKLRESIASLKDGGSLVMVLQEAQEIYGYLPREVEAATATGFTAFANGRGAEGRELPRRQPA